MFYIMQSSNPYFFRKNYDEVICHHLNCTYLRLKDEMCFQNRKCVKMYLLTPPAEHTALPGPYLDLGKEKEWEREGKKGPKWKHGSKGRRHFMQKVLIM